MNNIYYLKPFVQPLSDVGFLGQGYVEMASRNLRRDSNFGFTFKTMEANALLMVSTFVGQVRLVKKINLN